MNLTATHQAEVDAIQTSAEVREELARLSRQLNNTQDEIDELAGEIDELEIEKMDLESKEDALKERLVLLEGMEADPNYMEKLALIAAINHPNQAKFPFLKDGAT